MNDTSPKGSRRNPSQAPPELAGQELEPTPALGASPSYAYAALGAGLGVLVGAAIAAGAWHHTGQAAATKAPAIQAPENQAPAGRPSAPSESNVVHADFSVPALRDLGLVKSNNAGLKAHLTTSWDEKVGYRLTVEPVNPAQRATFAAVVSDPPRPLTVTLELKDGAGLVVCSQDVLLKYDPTQAAVAARTAMPQADLDRMQAEELKRENGRDIFQNDLGKDGRIQAISSEGVMPCSKGDYASAAFWSFTSDFPSLAEQAKLTKPQPVKQALANIPVHTVKAAATRSLVVLSPPAPHKVNTVQKTAGPRTPPAVVKVTLTRKPAARVKVTPARAAITAPAPAIAAANLAVLDKPAAFFIEGDDAVIDYDPSAGVLETSAGKRFFLDKTTGLGNVDVWADNRAHVHYRCDESTSTCTLSHAGVVLQHARLKG
jgi:hypothetical protein